MSSHQLVGLRPSSHSLELDLLLPRQSRYGPSGVGTAAVCWQQLGPAVLAQILLLQ